MSFRFSCLFLCLIIVVAFGQSPLPVGMRHSMQANSSPAGAIPYGNNPKVGYYIKADDACIYYEIYGKGRPVVVLHGGEVDSTCEMTQFIGSLSKRYQIVAVQMIPNSQLGIIPRAGHVVFLENFPAVWSSIVPFLKNPN